jgi:2-phosphosulfolactate phosphatase
MRIQTFLVPAETTDANYKGKPVVVIDVLRASTSIVAAKANGAEKVIPIATIEAATRLAATLDRDSTLLCGEREGRRIDGFDLGNSPREFVAAAVTGKTIIMTTTNGTEAIARLEGAREIIVCGLVNASAVASYLRSESEIVIACSGRNGRFSIEDAVCAGALIARLRDLAAAPALDDGSAACELLYAIHGADLRGCLRGSVHGRYLADLGLGDDLDDCAAIDTQSTVPIVREGRIV